MNLLQILLQKKVCDPLRNIVQCLGGAIEISYFPGYGRWIDGWLLGYLNGRMNTREGRRSYWKNGNGRDEYGHFLAGQDPDESHGWKRTVVWYLNWFYRVCQRVGRSRLNSIKILRGYCGVFSGQVMRGESSMLSWVLDDGSGEAE